MVIFPSMFIVAKSLISELMFSGAGSAKENSPDEEEDVRVAGAGEEVFGGRPDAVPLAAAETAASISFLFRSWNLAALSLSRSVFRFDFTVWAF